MRRALSRWLAAAGLVMVVGVSRAALAGPQGTVALTVGAAGSAPDDEGLRPLGDPPRGYWQSTEFHLGLRGDVLFGRKRNSDFGLGPYAEVLTNGFDELQFGGGASLLLPVFDTLPFVVSGGGYGRVADDGYPATGGFAASLFWGSRSYNFHSPYVLAAGLLGEFRYGLGPNRETSIVIAAQIDLVAFSLPFVFLAAALRGGSPDAAPIKPTSRE